MQYISNSVYSSFATVRGLRVRCGFFFRGAIVTSE
jgi:hypothetical protein